tara:strand:+ start:73 stop:321 length:249 start_codon:yes stop_codon:yes gene_type:complete
MKANKSLGVVIGIIIGMAIVISCTRPLSSNTAASDIGKYQVSTVMESTLNVGWAIFVTIIDTETGEIVTKEGYKISNYEIVP